MQTKTCSKGANCIHPDGPELPATTEYFSRESRTKDGLRSQCKACISEAGKPYRSNNRDVIRERKARYYVDNKAEIRKAKAQYRATHSEQIRDSKSRYWFENREVLLAKKKHYYSENRERILEGLRVYREQNKAKLQEYHKQYYAEHSEKVRERSRRWRIENTERARARSTRYRIENPDKVRLTPAENRAKHLNRRARKMELPFAAVNENLVRSYFDNRCAVCGRLAGLWHIIALDHWIAVKDSRPDNPGSVPTNIVPLCHSVKGSNGQGSCNLSKGNKDPYRWLIDTYGKRKAAQILKRINEYFEWVSEQDKAA